MRQVHTARGRVLLPLRRVLLHRRARRVKPLRGLGGRCPCYTPQVHWTGHDHLPDRPALLLLEFRTPLSLCHLHTQENGNPEVTIEKLSFDFFRLFTTPKHF